MTHDETTMTRRNWWWSVLGALVLVALLAGGYEQFVRAKSQRSARAKGPAAVAVGTVRAERRDFPVVLEANGTVTPLNTVDIHAQVSAVVDKVLIAEGQFVKAGQPLFTLDSRAAQVEVSKARAQLARDQAQLADAERQLERARDLQRQNFVAQSAVDTNQAQVDAQRAAVAADRAAVDAAQVTLGYSRIDAPSAGRAGAIAVHPGSYVQPGTTTLVTITQLDPIAVAFSLPQRNLPEALARLSAGGTEVTAQLPNSAGRLQGRLRFVDNAIDANSGTVRVKAVFDNPAHALWPGAYVSVRLPVETIRGAIVVPQAALIQGAGGKSLYVVENGKARLREVAVLASAGNQAVVDGLAGGEHVVVEGRQNLRPGAAVVEPAAPGAASAAVASAASAP